jgi:Holliday junction resolvase RusA-like endonuclease
MQSRLPIKPFSINQAWVGKLRKTSKHRGYIKDLSAILKQGPVPSGKLQVEITWGFSSKASDIDNPVKPFIDALQLKYGFNDKDIYRLIMNKEIVKRGKEFIDFKITEIESD